MTTHRFRFPFRRTLALAATSLLLSVAIATPSSAFFYNYYNDSDDPEDFEDCAEELLDSGLPDEQVAIACAESLVPEDLSACVSDITAHTPVEANTALSECFRARRPVELANCTVDITRETIEPYYRSDLDDAGVGARDALELCRRSLLPERYSACVVGLSRPRLNLTPMDAMSACIEAEDFPRELYVPATNLE